MADYYKFIIGKATAASTPSAPVINPGDFYEFSINPVSWASAYSGGSLTTVISGTPRISTTQIPYDAVSLSWPKLSATAKRDKCDYYFLLCDKLILIDDQLYMYEAVVAPNSYRYARRRSTKSEPEAYTVEVQLILLGPGYKISESARESMETVDGTGVYIGEDLLG